VTLSDWDCLILQNTDQTVLEAWIWSLIQSIYCFLGGICLEVVNDTHVFRGHLLVFQDLSTKNGSKICKGISQLLIANFVWQVLHKDASILVELAVYMLLKQTFKRLVSQLVLIQDFRTLTISSVCTEIDSRCSCDAFHFCKKHFCAIDANFLKRVAEFC